MFPASLHSHWASRIRVCVLSMENRGRPPLRGVRGAVSRGLGVGWGEPAAHGGRQSPASAPRERTLPFPLPGPALNSLHSLLLEVLPLLSPKSIVGLVLRHRGLSHPRGCWSPGYWDAALSQCTSWGVLGPLPPTWRPTWSPRLLAQPLPSWPFGEGSS